MKLSLPILLVICSFSSFSQKRKIDIKIYYSQKNCQGLENISEDSIPTPYSNKSIIFVSEKGKVDSAKTNTGGQLQLRLKKGRYTLFEPWRYNLYTPQNLPIGSFDRGCLIKEWEKVLFTIVITKETVKVVQNNPLVHLCPENIPCLQNTP